MTITITGSHDEGAVSFDEQMKVLHSAIFHEPVKPTIVLDGSSTLEGKWVKAFSITGLPVTGRVDSVIGDDGRYLSICDKDNNTHWCTASSAKPAAEPVEAFDKVKIVLG